MANRLARYNPNLVAVTIAGVLADGYADGSFVDIKAVTDAFQDVCGTDGEVALSPSNDRRVELTLKLMQTSLMNTVLTGLIRRQLANPNTPTFEVSVENTLGGSLTSGAECWISKWPDEGYDRTAGSREWTIRIANGDRSINGV